MDGDSDNRLHYFLLSFTHMGPGGWVSASASIGYPEKEIYWSKIQSAKRSNDLPPESVCMAVSYLGYMTPEEARS